MPCCRIDSINSSSASRAKSFRGCNVLGTILASSIWCTLSPASKLSLGVATAGVLINAPRPLPKPERAIASEATGTEFATQTAKRRAIGQSMRVLRARQELVPHCNEAPPGSYTLKNTKKSIDTRNRNPVSR